MLDTAAMASLLRIPTVLPGRFVAVGTAMLVQDLSLRPLVRRTLGAPAQARLRNPA